MEESEVKYRLTVERQEALGKLDSLLSQAGRLEIHTRLGLPEAISTRFVDEVANYRVAVRNLLRSHLEDFKDSKEQKLVREIIDGITRVDLIITELKKKPRLGGNDPNSDPSNGADQACSAA